MATKTIESLELAIAQKGVCDYAADVARASEHGDDPAECDRHVQQAIEAYRWISRAEESVRQGIYDGLIEYAPQLDEAIQSLHREWLVSCLETERLLARQVERGCAVANAGEFQEVASLARAKINSMAWVRSARKFRNEAACEASEN